MTVPRWTTLAVLGTSLSLAACSAAGAAQTVTSLDAGERRTACDRLDPVARSVLEGSSPTRVDDASGCFWRAPESTDVVGLSAYSGSAQALDGMGGVPMSTPASLALVRVRCPGVLFEVTYPVSARGTDLADRAAAALCR